MNRFPTLTFLMLSGSDDPASPNCDFVKINKIGCSGKEDLYILISRGRETDRAEFGYRLEFAEKLARDSRMHIGQDQVHFSLGYYPDHSSLGRRFLIGSGHASYVHSFLHLSSDSNHVISQLATLKVRVGHDGTNSASLSQALDTVRVDMLTRGRSDAKKVVLVVMDQNDDTQAKVHEAFDKLKRACISLNVVTVPSMSMAYSRTIRGEIAMFGKVEDHYRYFEKEKNSNELSQTDIVNFFESGCT